MVDNNTQEEDSKPAASVPESKEEETADAVSKGTLNHKPAKATAVAALTKPTSDLQTAPATPATVTPEKRKVWKYSPARFLDRKRKFVAMGKEEALERQQKAQRWVYCIGGVSGAGKSHLISQHHKLKDLPRIDIADDYTAMGPVAANRRGSYVEAFERFSTRLKQSLQESSSNVVAELACSSNQRREVEQLVRRISPTIAVVWIWKYAERRECKRRVLQDGRDDPQRRDKRLQWIRGAPGCDFQAKPFPFQTWQEALGEYNTQGNEEGNSES